MSITKEKLQLKKIQLIIMLVVVSLILCFSQYRLKQLQKENHHLKMDYSILLQIYQENCR